MGGTKGLSLNAVLALVVLHNDRETEWYGLVIIQRLGLKSGSAYPMLRQLEAQGLISGEEEDVDPASVGRPRRHIYTLTELGEQVARAQVERIRSVIGD